MRTGRIVKREWLDEAIPRIASSLRLYRENKIPQTIEIFMVATPLKHALRGIYGKGNLGVAWALLMEALREYFAARYWDFRYKIGWLNEDMREAEREIAEDGQ